MKLSTETIAIIKNFSRIHPSLIIEPGNVIKVRSEVVFAEATVAETFAKTVRLSDSLDFLRALALFKEPELDVVDDHIHIADSNGIAEFRYPLAKADLPLPLPMPKRIKPEPDEQITFALTEEQLATLQKALGISGVYKKADWEIRKLVALSDGKTIRLITERGNKKPGYSLVVCGVTNGLECRCTFDANSIPLIAGSYQVMLTASSPCLNPPF